MNNEIKFGKRVGWRSHETVCEPVHKSDRSEIAIKVGKHEMTRKWPRSDCRNDYAIFVRMLDKVVSENTFNLFFSKSVMDTSTCFLSNRFLALNMPMDHMDSSSI